MLELLTQTRIADDRLARPHRLASSRAADEGGLEARLGPMPGEESPARTAIPAETAEIAHLDLRRSLLLDGTATGVEYDPVTRPDVESTERAPDEVLLHRDERAVRTALVLLDARHLLSVDVEIERARPVMTALVALDRPRTRDDLESIVRLGQRLGRDDGARAPKQPNKPCNDPTHRHLLTLRPIPDLPQAYLTS